MMLNFVNGNFPIRRDLRTRSQRLSAIATKPDATLIPKQYVILDREKQGVYPTNIQVAPVFS
jgi:hypothetical protein